MLEFLVNRVRKATEAKVRNSVGSGRGDNLWSNSAKRDFKSIAGGGGVSITEG